MHSGKHAGIYASCGKLLTLNTSTSFGKPRCAFRLHKDTGVDNNTVFTFVFACSRQKCLIGWNVRERAERLIIKHRHTFVSYRIKDSPFQSHSYAGPNRWTCSVRNSSPSFICHGDAVILFSILMNCQSSTGQFTTFLIAGVVVNRYTVSEQFDLRIDALRLLGCKNEMEKKLLYLPGTDPWNQEYTRTVSQEHE